MGGGARGRLLLEVRASVTGLPVSRPEDVETTARGAAMLAAVGRRAASERRRGRARDGRARASADGASPTRAMAGGLRRAPSGATAALYDALRPLFV